MCTETIPVSFLLLRNLPMGFSTTIVSTQLKYNTCNGEQLRIQGATDVLSAQVGSRSPNNGASSSLEYSPVYLNFMFVTSVNTMLESYHCVYWNFSEPYAMPYYVLKAKLMVILFDSIGNGRWATAGITTDDVITQSTTYGYLRTVTCRSTHLTSFAVFVSLFKCLRSTSPGPVTTSTLQAETVTVTVGMYA